MERQVKRNTEIETCCNNIKLLTEMLNHYSPSSPAQDKELMKVRRVGRVLVPRCITEEEGRFNLKLCCSCMYYFFCP